MSSATAFVGAGVAGTTQVRPRHCASLRAVASVRSRAGRSLKVGICAMAVPPINFAGQIPPFPNPNQGLHTVNDVLIKHPKWEWKEGMHGPVLQRHLSTNHDAKKGHEVLEALQTELYQTNHKGCQIKRETQEKYTMCCEGVEILLNESRKDLLIDVAIGQSPDAQELEQADSTLRKVEGVLKRMLHHV